MSRLLIIRFRQSLHARHGFSLPLLIGLVFMKQNRKLIWINALLLVLAFLILRPPAENVAAQNSDVNIYMFYGEGCPHCAQAKPVLMGMAEENPRVGYNEFEVYYSEENQKLFFDFGIAFGMEPQYVPTIFIGERYWVGYSEDIRIEIENYIEQCLNSGCADPGGEVLGVGTPAADTSTPEPTPTPSESAEFTATPLPQPSAEIEPSNPGEEGPDRSITLPLIGTVDLSNQSLLLSTILIALVDGFNPCSIWVLSMLLAITLNTRSRKKVLIIGFVFIFVTGLIYALFIGGLFTVFKIINFVGWIQLIVALVALIFGLVNIKDYFWYKEGLSFTISDEKKPGIYKGIRRLAKADGSIIGLITGTVVLAAGVSLVEFSCTAGFPVLWTNLLAAQNVSGLAFVGFLLVYMLIYQIDELGIFLVSVFTLRKSKLEEKHGRILKLLGGMLMLTLAVVMLVDPTLMNNVNSALLVFGIAFAVAGLVLLVHRVILPKFNIKIGSED